MNEPEVIILGLLARATENCEECPYVNECYDGYSTCESIIRANEYIADLRRYDDAPF